ncbi:hypothetical protein [uncultured Novosphingobium sp.]|uniref:hypothetical protein n=1 Tax=uncultured Novosphingobium sp. TaxID=292277 RepID=UPI002599F32B|nr:hypothetical protein [uncultured Novosphingobium sp.]
MNSGWICLHRGWRDNPLFKGEYSRADAWVWLIENACWKASRSRIKGEAVELQRGELTFSQRFLADKWGWSKSRVDRFIADLRAEGMIETRSKNGATPGHSAGQGQSIITICNYAKYQDVSEAKRGNAEPENGATAGQQRGKEEQRNQETIIPSPNGDGHGEAAPLCSDLAASIFRTGLVILGEAGHAEQSARRMIGKWRKSYSTGSVIAVLASCQNQNPRPSDPIGWINGALQAEQLRAAGQTAYAQGPRDERASVSEIGASVAAELAEQRERALQNPQERIALGGR